MQFLIPLPVLLSMNNIKKCHVRQPQTHESIKKLLYLIRVLSSWSCLTCSFQCASQCRSEEDLFHGQLLTCRARTERSKPCLPRWKQDDFQCVQVGDELKRATVSLDELELPGRLMNVFVKDHCCTDSIEKLYYSCGFEPICVHCASEEVTDCTASQFLPQCQECISQGLDRVNRPKKNRNLCVLLCFVYMCLCAFVSDISIIIF